MAVKMPSEALSVSSYPSDYIVKIKTFLWESAFFVKMYLPPISVDATLLRYNVGQSIKKKLENGNRKLLQFQ